MGRRDPEPVVPKRWYYEEGPGIVTGDDSNTNGCIIGFIRDRQGYKAINQQIGIVRLQDEKFHEKLQGLRDKGRKMIFKLNEEEPWMRS